MQKEITTLNEIHLVGISTRTNNTQLFEQDPSSNKIAATVQKYFQEGLAQKIANRKKPGTTFCAYTNYESDINGDYTFFIGEEVNSLPDIPEGFESLTIPLQKYAKFTNEPGPMPTVCIDMWKSIWAMDAESLGGYRAYGTDFEIYDERSADYNNATLDLYISLKVESS